MKNLVYLTKPFIVLLYLYILTNRLSYKLQSEGGTKVFHSKLTKDFFESIVH